MPGGVGADVVDGLLQALHDAHSQVQRAVLGVPVGLSGLGQEVITFSGRRSLGQDPVGRGVSVQDGVLVPQGAGSRRQVGGGDVGVDQERLGGVAHADALGLGVDDNVHRGLQIGAGVDVDVAVARSGLDDGDGGLLDDGADEPGPSPRHQGVDEAVSAHEGAGPIPTGGIDAGDEVCGQSLRLQGAAQGRDDGGVGVLGGTTSAQDDGVAGLDGQGSGVDGDIGAGLVDHADDAQWHPNPTHSQSVGHDRAVHDLTHGVGQGGHLTQGVGDGRQSAGVQGQAVEEAGLHPALASALQVGGVGREDRFAVLGEAVGHGLQGGVLDGAWGPGQAPLRHAG